MALFSPQGIADWWRGYSESDVISLRIKLAGETRPGGLIYLNEREYRALRAGMADRDVPSQRTEP